jgi:hypothetical protein
MEKKIKSGGKTEKEDLGRYRPKTSAKQAVQLLLGSFTVLFVCFLVLELIFRAASPGSASQSVIAEGITRGKSRFHSQLEGGYENVNVRVPVAGQPATIDRDRDLILGLGDSVTDGHGHAYEDIYWVLLQRMLDLFFEDSPQFVPYAKSGENLDGVLEPMTRMLGEGLPVVEVLYQFNFNDVTPYSRQVIRDLADTGITRTSWFQRLGRFRYSHMTHSAFFVWLQGKVAPILHKTKGTCEERGLDALIQYSWAYGSRPVASEAEGLWDDFENQLLQLRDAVTQAGAEFTILIIPHLYQVDTMGLHLNYNRFNYDFSCATIRPRERLLDFATQNGIGVVDMTDALRDSFERRVRGGNFMPYFFPNDTNHPNETASAYIANGLARHFLEKARERG